MFIRRHRGVTMTDVVACSMAIPLILGALIPAMASRDHDSGA